MGQNEMWADTVIERIRGKMAWVSEKNQNKIPYRTDENGDYDDRSDPAKEWNVDDGINWWTNGFWGGIMWLLYQDTGDEKYIRIARLSEERMERCFHDHYGLHHDVGFMFIIRLSAKGTDGVMKPISVFHFLKFSDIVSFVRLAYYRTRGEEWRGGIAANPACLYVVGHP